MKEQVLDSMELERERGITIQMQPVRMFWKDYILNLIDTPGHIDFSYEVSRALRAVEGAILLVDSTQSVQAQTITVLEMARKAGLSIIPAVTKVDSPLARIAEVKAEIIGLLECRADEIMEVSGKTGQGVEQLLERVLEKVPAPKVIAESFAGLVFDFKYSTHKGVIVFARVVSGKVLRGDKLLFKIANRGFEALEVGIFTPEEKPTDNLQAGEIGYIVTGIKEPGVATVGDTVALLGDKAPALPGYQKAEPLVWAAVYPSKQNDFILLRQSLSRLKLSDSSFSFEEESSSILGKGFRCGFLGMLHLEIISERLKREFNMDLVITSPSITYEMLYTDGKREKIYSPAFFPEEGLIKEVFEPIVKTKIITPNRYIGEILQILYEHEAAVENTNNFGGALHHLVQDGRERTVILSLMPLRELYRSFFDRLKSASKGYASLSYELSGKAHADVTRLDLLINGETEAAFSRVVSRKTVEKEAQNLVERLSNILPRQMIAVKIQAKALGRIISSKTISALRKDVTQHMYGGDITRKMKLREKQKKGKKKMQSIGKVNIPQDIFLKMIKPD
jgi:GTP-binding protein LepA